MSPDPLTIGLMLASTGLSAVQASSAAKAEQAQLAYQSQVAQNNADIAEDNRQRTIQEANIAAADKDLEASSILGEAVAQAGASGLDLSTGSKSAAITSKKKLAARDRARIVSEGAIEGGRFAQQRAGFQNRSANLLTASSNAGAAGRFNVFSSLVSGAARTAGSFRSASGPGTVRTLRTSTATI